MVTRAFGVLLTAVAMLFAGGVHASTSIETGRGSWYGTNGLNGTLRGRDMDGNPVNLLVAAGTVPNPNMVFVYDTQLNLTWLAEWNVQGEMDWATASFWAAGLDIGGFTGWSLPSTLDVGDDGCNFSTSGGTDCGYNVYSGEVQRRGSPLAHMFHDTLANLSRCTPGDPTCSPEQQGWDSFNTGPFSNMQTWVYWSATADALDPSTNAWIFNGYYGHQNIDGQNHAAYAVAVRPGDVLPIPESQSFASLLTALGALSVVAGCRRTRRGFGALGTSTFASTDGDRAADQVPAIGCDVFDRARRARGRQSKFASGLRAASPVLGRASGGCPATPRVR
jgi:hypothetical protein